MARNRGQRSATARSARTSVAIARALARRLYTLALCPWPQWVAEGEAAPIEEVVNYLLGIIALGDQAAAQAATGQPDEVPLDHYFQ